MRLLAAAVLVCGALTTSALALSPTLRDYLAQALGSFTSYSQEPEGAVAVDQDVEIRVVSAVTDQYRMKIYVEAQDLTGEYFTDDRIRIWWEVPREWGVRAFLPRLMPLPTTRRPTPPSLSWI